MKILWVFLTVVVLLASATAGPVFGTTAVKSFELRFGILSQPKPRIFVMKEETTTIPRHYNQTGFRFGYLIWEKNRKPFQIETVTYPPSAPRMLGNVHSDQSLSGGLRSGPIQLNDGKGATGFGFDPGDPTGLWKMEFFVDGKLLRTVEFTVYEPNEKSKSSP